MINRRHVKEGFQLKTFSINLCLLEHKSLSRLKNIDALALSFYFRETF